MAFNLLLSRGVMGKYLRSNFTWQIHQMLCTCLYRSERSLLQWLQDLLAYRNTKYGSPWTPKVPRTTCHTSLAACTRILSSPEKKQKQNIFTIYKPPTLTTCSDFCLFPQTGSLVKGFYSLFRKCPDGCAGCFGQMILSPKWLLYGTSLRLQEAHFWEASLGSRFLAQKVASQIGFQDFKKLLLEAQEAASWSLQEACFFGFQNWLLELASWNYKHI